MQLVELKVNMIIAKNPNLNNSLDRSIKDPLLKNYSIIPFQQHKCIRWILPIFMSF